MTAKPNHLRGIESVPPNSTTDPRDVRARIEELKLLKQGWLDGKGSALSRDGLDWLATKFGRSYPRHLPAPYLFPTPEGHVLAEWSLSPWSPSLEIDLVSRRGECHALNLATEEEITKALNLENANDWKWLAKQIEAMVGEAEERA